MSFDQATSEYTTQDQEMLSSASHVGNGEDNQHIEDGEGHGMTLNAASDGKDGIDQATEGAGARTGSTEDKTPAGARKRANLEAGSKRPASSGDDDDRKAKLREANRKAAERSRGKKRDELSNLELTVSKIQEENARLRSQLEALLAAAKSQQHKPAEAGSTAPPADSITESHAHVDGTTSTQEQSVDPTLTLSENAAVEEPQAVPIALGADGLDLETLKSLTNQIRDLKEQITLKEAQIEARAGPAEGNAALANLASLKSTVDRKAVEKSALLALIDQLQSERDASDAERLVLERELEERRAIVKLINRANEAQRKQIEENKENADGAFAANGGQEINYDDLKGRSNVGVERALMEVRGWVDDAIRDWKKTGVLRAPPASLMAVPNPAAPSSQMRILPASQSIALRSAPGKSASSVDASMALEVHADEQLDDQQEMQEQQQSVAEAEHVHDAHVDHHAGDFDDLQHFDAAEDHHVHDDHHHNHHDHVHDVGHEHAVVDGSAEGGVTDQMTAAQIHEQDQDAFGHDLANSEEYMHLMAAVAANQGVGVGDDGQT